MSRPRHPSDETFGHRLQELREHQNWSLYDLAALTGWAETTLRRYELGAVPSIERILFLAMLYRVDHIWLLTGVEAA